MDDRSDPATIETDPLGADGPTGRRGTKVALAVGVVLLLAALAVPLAMRGNEPAVDELPTLGLASGGAGAERAMAGDAALSMMAADVEYRVGGELPDLGDAAPVWQTMDPGVDAAWVDSAAVVLDVPGEVTPLDIAPAVGWQVGDGGLTVMGGPLPMLSYWDGGGVATSSSSAGCSSPGVAVETVPEGDETAEGAPAAAAPDVPADGCRDVVVEDVAPACCAPSDAEAEAIARTLLTDLGVPGEWDATVQASAAAFEAVACAPGVECTDAAPSEEQVLTRTVWLTRVVDGQAAAGLEWSVEVGVEGVIVSASGPVVELEKLGDYPLRPVDETVQALVDGDPSAIQAPTSMSGGWSSYAAAGGGVVPLGAPDAISSSEVPSSDALAEAEAGETVQAYRATDLIPRGTPGVDALDQGLIADERIPEEYRPETAITSTDEILGKAAQFDIGPGTIIVQDMFVDLTTVTTVAPDVVGTGPVGPTGTVVCVTDPCPGGDVALPEPMPVDPVPVEPVPVEPMPVEPVPEPMPYVEPEPIVVTITGAELARAVMYGTAPDGSPAVYVVPTYELQATTADGTPWPVALVAVSPELVAPPELAEPEPLPVPDTSVLPTTSTVEGIDPPSSPTTETTLPVDPYPGPTVVEPGPEVTFDPCEGSTPECSNGTVVTTVPVTTVPVTTIP